MASRKYHSADDLRSRLNERIRAAMHFHMSHDEIIQRLDADIFNTPSFARLTRADKQELRALCFFLTLGPDDLSPVMGRTEHRLGWPAGQGMSWYASFDAWRDAWPTADPSALTSGRFWKGTDKLYYGTVGTS